MSKSLGNFSRCATCSPKAYKPPRCACPGRVPYRRQLNFTFDGLQQATSFRRAGAQTRGAPETGKFPAGSQPAIAERIAKLRMTLTPAFPTT